MKKIALSNVLSKINQSNQNGQRKIYEIGFYKANGEFRKLRVTRHARNGVYESDKSEGSKFNYNLRDKGLLIIENVDARNTRERTKNIHICLLVSFEGIRIHHDC
jgi:hypothetical protein